MNKLVLYTTEGCHLCEHAEVLLQEFASSSTNAFDYRLDAIDISTDEGLVELYGIRIPVVRNLTTEKEVAWPFSVEDLLTLF
jgi:hypothetical protein